MDDRAFIIGLGRAFLGRALAESEIARLQERLTGPGSRQMLVEEFMASEEAVRLSRVPLFVPPVISIPRLSIRRRCRRTG